MTIVDIKLIECLLVVGIVSSSRTFQVVCCVVCEDQRSRPFLRTLRQHHRRPEQRVASLEIQGEASRRQNEKKTACSVERVGCAAGRMQRRNGIGMLLALCAWRNGEGRGAKDGHDWVWLSADDGRKSSLRRALVKSIAMLQVHKAEEQSGEARCSWRHGRE